jgi:hypothetical protein
LSPLPHPVTSVTNIEITLILTEKAEMNNNNNNNNWKPTEPSPIISQTL